MHRTATRATLAGTLALGLVATAAAQNGPLVGFSANPNTPTSNIIRQVLCNPPGVWCPNVLPAPAVDYAGGAAYDPMRRSVWHTEGTRLLEVILDGCKTDCAMPAHLALGARSMASGLTINASRREMYQVETIPGTAAIVTYRFGAAAPCPQNVAECKFPLASQDHLAGAIAFDGKRDLIWVANSTFKTTPDNFLYVFRRGDPNCQPFCRVQVRSCLTGLLQSIRAMAYDECRDLLYVSDGRQTSVQAVVWATPTACPILRPLSCCPLQSPLGEFWAGFDLLPGPITRQGKSCTQRPCPSCPAMSLDAIGDPVVGNAAFALEITSAPSGGTGYVLFNIGPCQPIPLFCGRLYPALNPPPGVLGPVAMPGVGTCGGTGLFPLPIPNNYALCGLPLCSQGIIVCGPLGGIGLTNALEFSIGN